MTTPDPAIRIRADQLEKFRQLTGLTTAVALARRMGVHEATVRRTLGGDTQLTTDFMAALMRAFPSLTLSDLFETGEDAPAKAMTA